MIKAPTMTRALTIILLLTLALLAAGCYTQLGTREDEGVLPSSRDDNQEYATDQSYQSDDYYYYAEGPARSTVGFYYYYPSAFPSDIFAYESATYLTPTYYGVNGYGSGYGSGYGYGNGYGYADGYEYWSGYGGGHRWNSGWYSPLNDLPPAYYYYRHSLSPPGGGRVSAAPSGGQTGQTSSPTREIGSSRMDVPTGGTLPSGARLGTGATGTTPANRTVQPSASGRAIGNDRGQSQPQRTDAPVLPSGTSAPAERGGATRTSVRPAAIPPAQSTPAQSPQQPASSTPSNDNTTRGGGVQQAPPPAPAQQPAQQPSGGRQSGETRDKPPRP